jgi:hypothetical protein
MKILRQFELKFCMNCKGSAVKNTNLENSGMAHVINYVILL